MDRCGQDAAGACRSTPIIQRFALKIALPSLLRRTQHFQRLRHWNSAFRKLLLWEDRETAASETIAARLEHLEKIGCKQIESPEVMLDSFLSASSSRLDPC